MLIQIDKYKVRPQNYNTPQTWQSNNPLIDNSRIDYLNQHCSKKSNTTNKDSINNAYYYKTLRPKKKTALNTIVLTKMIVGRAT